MFQHLGMPSIKAMMLIRKIVQHSLFVGFGKNIRDLTQAFSNLFCLLSQP